MKSNLSGQQLWEKMYKRSCLVARTWRQAYFLFKRQYGYWPKPEWPYMPRDKADERRFIADTPPENLVPPETTDGKIN